MIARTAGATHANSTLRANSIPYPIPIDPVDPVDVLVVDDDEPTRAVVIDALKFAGYEARGAPDGAYGLVLAERLRPRLILLDLWMPVMDGWQFAAHYRNVKGPTAPIVLMSADPQLPAATDQLGSYGFIRKPFDLDFFREIVARAINASAQQRLMPASDPSFNANRPLTTLAGGRGGTTRVSPSRRRLFPGASQRPPSLAFGRGMSKGSRTRASSPLFSMSVRLAIRRP
jgi:two-component system, chemotaxis family, chemotaxis protein CheY